MNKIYTKQQRLFANKTVNIWGFQISFLNKQKQHTFQMFFSFLWSSQQTALFLLPFKRRKLKLLLCLTSKFPFNKVKMLLRNFCPLTNGCIYPRLPSNTFICSHSSFPQIDFFSIFLEVVGKNSQSTKTLKGSSPGLSLKC